MKQAVGITIVVAAVCVFLLQTGCGRTSRSETKDANEGARVPVEIARVKAGDIASFFTGTAALEAEQETEVVAKVGGVVESIMAEAGDYVTADQVLAKLDDERLALEVERAAANFRNLESEQERYRKLYDENLVSDQEFNRVKHDYEQQKAVYDLSELELRYTSIRAPISGVVAERLIKVGNMVLANQPVFRVTGMDPLLAVLHVPERQMSKLKVGHAAKVRVDALEGLEFSGKITRISPVVDPNTGTVKVTVEVRDPARGLKPGMFARIDIIHDVHTNSVLAPKDAVIIEDEESSVFVVSDSTAYRRIVETGYVNSTHIEIVKGLAAGDTVVTTGKGSLKDSTRVDPVAGDIIHKETNQAGKQEAPEGQAEPESPEESAPPDSASAT
jgi:membrane fusion protein (multidrug efflux system)